MWQRIQSVFLGVTILSLLLGLIFPIWIGEDQEAQYLLSPFSFMIKQKGKITEGHQYFPFCITAILMVSALMVAIQEIRRYDDRILQVKLGTLNSLFLAGVMVCAFIFSNQVTTAHPVNWKYDYSLWLSFTAVTCNWLAIRFIRRDEKRVRDSDRIR